MKKSNAILHTITISLLISSCLTGRLLVPTLTIAPSITLTNTATTTYTNTKTNTTTKSFTSTFTPTIATLPPDDARKRMHDLLIDNGGCRLPCFWGITPGISIYDEALQNFIQLSNIANLIIINENSFGITLGLEEKGSNVAADISVYSFIDRERIKKVQNIMLNLSWDIETNLFDFYKVPHILSDNGRPSEVLLFTYNAPINEYDTLSIFIFYQDQGIIAYYMMEKKESGENIVACLSDITFNNFDIELLPPGNIELFVNKRARILQAKSGYREEVIKSIEEVTSMTLDDFYNAYKNPANDCITTPADNWPTDYR
jgi:hypothetical protein